MTLNFAATLSDLRPPPAGGEGEKRYLVREIPDRGHFIGKDSNGCACLLLSSRDHGPRAPIRLALLEVQFSVHCRVIDDHGGESTRVLTVIACQSHDDAVTGYFAHVAETIVCILGDAPLASEVAEVVRRLAELFQNLSRSTGRSLAGLFGELLVIHLCRSPRTAVMAWRSAVDNRFDFSIDDVRIEAKSSSDRTRNHFFSREQCLPPDGTVGVLISLLVERSGGGLSLGELVQRIEQQMGGDADSILRVHATIAETLGNATTAAMETRFDEHLAYGSIRIYDLSLVPAIRSELPPEVSQVRFRANLNQTPVADRDHLEMRSVRVGDLLPHHA